MTNQDYQSSKWTNGGYIIEWVTQDDIKITRLAGLSSIQVSCTIDNFEFVGLLNALLFSREHQCTPINKE